MKLFMSAMKHSEFQGVAAPTSDLMILFLLDAEFADKPTPKHPEHKNPEYKSTDKSEVHKKTLLLDY